MATRLDKTQRTVLKIYGWVIGIGLLYAVWVWITGWGLPCFYYLTTGFYCPGCGTSRMFLSLFQLQFADAFHYNPVVLILFCLWNMIALGCFFQKPRFARKTVFLLSALYVTVGILTVYGVLRNILG